MKLIQAVLLGGGYATTIPVIARFRRVVHERRWRWLAVHHLGVAALIAAFVQRGSRPAVAVNSAWLIIASCWWILGSRRRVESPV